MGGNGAQQPLKWDGTWAPEPQVGPQTEMGSRLCGRGEVVTSALNLGHSGKYS